MFFFFVVVHCPFSHVSCFFSSIPFCKKEEEESPSSLDTEEEDEEEDDDDDESSMQEEVKARVALARG